MGRGGLGDEELAVSDLARPKDAGQQKALGLLFETGAAAMLVWNNSHRTIDANGSACRLLSRPKNILLSLSLSDLTPKSALDNLDALFKALKVHGNHNGHHTFSAPDGEGIHVVYAATANIMPGIHLGIFHPDSKRKPANELSARERDILSLLARGENNRTIAQQLYLAPETVRNYTRSARQKLGARSRSHAIALAISSGQIRIDS